MEVQTNRRGYPEHAFEKRHVKLNDLKREIRPNIPISKYLLKENIPAYPRPEFHVSHLKHDTNKEGLRGIGADNGFKVPANKKPSDGSPPLLWWSLSVGPDDIMSAERRLLESTYPDRTEEQAQRQQSFLEKFTTSPAFKKTARLGSYRFIFPLEELLKAYSEQFCGGAQPVIRVFKTVLYKQEVMYAVLVHSPANQEQFSEYPLLTDDPAAVCSYKDGCFTWRPQAMSETHWYELVLRPEDQRMEVQKTVHEFYVWDNVAVALHVDEKVLSFDSGRLRENLKFCEAEKPGLIRGIFFQAFPDAEKKVKELWPEPNYPSTVEKA